MSRFVDLVPTTTTTTYIPRLQSRAEWYCRYHQFCMASHHASIHTHSSHTCTSHTFNVTNNSNNSYLLFLGYLKIKIKIKTRIVPNSLFYLQNIHIYTHSSASSNHVICIPCRWGYHLLCYSSFTHTFIVSSFSCAIEFIYSFQCV